MSLSPLRSPQTRNGQGASRIEALEFILSGLQTVRMVAGRGKPMRTRLSSGLKVQSPLNLEGFGATLQSERVWVGCVAR